MKDILAVIFIVWFMGLIWDVADVVTGKKTSYDIQAEHRQTIADIKSGKRKF